MRGFTGQAYAAADTPREDKAAALRAAYRSVFAGELGQLVLADIVEQGGVFARNNAADDGGVVNAAAFGIYEGQRRLALRIATMAAADIAAPWAARSNPNTRAAEAVARTAKTENSE